MRNFKWLHLSDLHFRMYEGFDMTLILSKLRETLKEEARDVKFRYIFLTGDIADGYDYSMVEQRVKELLLDNSILEDGGKIFWVCGNHDIPRTLKFRKYEIESIRDKEQPNVTFENEFIVDENREEILRAFKEFYVKRENILGIKKEGEYPHEVVHTDEAEFVLLNTCLTSCDDEDEHKLYICESELIKLFDEIESGKPVFVLGHHSINFLADSDKSRLIKLFQEKNVSAYLCGHSHQLGVSPLYGNTQEIVSGGFKLDGHAIISFLIGIYNGNSEEYELVPYTYRLGSMNWAKDYDSVHGIKSGEKYSIYLLQKENEEELSNIIIRCQRLFQGISAIERLEVGQFNQIGERVLRKYVQIITGKNDVGKMKFSELCEAAVQCGDSKINYSSLKMSDTMRDVWRFRENLIRILRKMGRDDANFPLIKEVLFDFNDFYESVNRFDAMDNTYVLVTDAIHDIDNDKKKMLAEFQWDMILDYDGHSGNGGLRDSVSGQNIKDWSGDYRLVRESILRRGITSWIRIGEQMKFSLNKEESGLDLKEIRIFYEEVTRKLYENTNEAIIFVFMKDIEIWDKELMRIVWERFEDKSRFVMVGSYDEKKLDRQLQNVFLNSYGNEVKNCYTIFQTSATQFVQKYNEHSEDFLERKKYESILFPSNNGMEKLAQNLYVNLGDFFEVLVSDIGKDQKQRNADIETFYLGGQAAWSLFYSKDVLSIMENDIEEDLIHKLKTALGAKQEQPRNAVFYLLHDAGFGGSTVARGIAWRMHLDHPTLILKNYEYGKIKPLIQNLYDNHSRKGIFLIADESYFSISDLENLEREMGLVDRPFALLIVRRTGGMSKNNLKNAKRLNSLTRGIVSALKNRFSERSYLDVKTLEEKKAHFDEIFPKNSGMRCPFLIGLYYQDQHFNGVVGYVERIVQRVASVDELKLLLILSVINYYGRSGLTKELIKEYVSLSAKADYLEKYPYAKEAFICISDEALHVRLYREKHPLISYELMRQCSKKVYGSGYQENLRDVLEELIEKILKVNKEGITLYYKNLLERLFIYKNATDVDERGYTDVTEFSPLILDLPSQVSREEVMCKLAEGVKKVTNRISPEGNELYFKMAAHICGHLGRLYKASTVSLKQMENNEKSIEWCKSAEMIMKRGKFEDAYIYHMYGTSLSKQCHDRLNSWNSVIESCSREDIYELEVVMKEALEKFDQTAFTGEIVRGYISKLSLLMEYIQFLMKWKGIKSSNELQKLSDVERDYIKDIDVLISILEELELNPKDENRLLSLKSNYKAEVMFNNYGKAVEYYTNCITNIVREKGEDAEELYVLRSGLVSAILGKYRQEGKNPYLNMCDKDVDRILEALEKNIFSTTMLSDRWEQQSRCNDCHRWLKVAKQSYIAVQTGIKVAEKWKELQKETEIKDPRPYYYLTVLHYLNALDGYLSSLEIARVNQKEAYKIASNNSGLRVINTDKIRDILLEGKGMNRIKSVIDLSEALEQDGDRTIKLKGKFQGIQDERKPKIGTIKVIFPQELKNTNIYFKMGDKNTISINQSGGHILEFGIGFTFERLEAINSTVKDITSGEL